MRTYEIDMKKILKTEGGTVGFADGVLKAEEKDIYSALHLKGSSKITGAGIRRGGE